MHTTMADKIKELEPCTVYTSLPSSNGKHVRPIQTASLVCSCLCKCVHFLNLSKFPSKHDHLNSIINHLASWWYEQNFEHVLSRTTTFHMEWQQLLRLPRNKRKIMEISSQVWQRKKKLKSWISKLFSCSCCIFKWWLNGLKIEKKAAMIIIHVYLFHTW